MNIRNDIKARIALEGKTMRWVVEKLAKDYGWNENLSGLSGKLLRESIQYREVIQLADVLGYDVIWVKRKES